MSACVSRWMWYVLPEQLWQHLMSHWFANRALWTVASRVQRMGLLLREWFEPFCFVLAWGDVFSLRSSFSTPGSVRPRAASGTAQVWEQNSRNSAKARASCAVSLERTNPSNKEKSEISHVPFLSSQHRKRRRNTFIFGFLLKHEPLRFFLMYFDLVPRCAVWLTLPAPQVVSPSSSPLVKRSQIIANKRRAIRISYRKLLKLPEKAICRGDWGMLVAVICVQRRSLRDVKKWQHQEKFALPWDMLL